MGVTYNVKTGKTTKSDVDFVPEAVSAEKLRAARNAALRSSDWTQLPDAPLSSEEKAQWAEYRQSLRDLPSHEEFPDNAPFPKRPG